MYGLIAFLLVLIALVLLLSGRLPAGLRRGNQYPYERQKRFLSAAERSFYGVLCRVVRDDQVVLAKVRLADLVRVDPLVRRKEFWRHFNRIAGKHLDFVVCDRATMEPVYCVELDDKSHQERRRRDRDALVDGVMRAAELRMVRVPCRQAYGLEDVRAMVVAPVGVVAGQ